MGAFKVNQDYLDGLLARIQEKFDSDIGEAVVEEMRSRTPKSTKRQYKSKRRGETRRQVYLSYASGESRDPRSHFGGGRSYYRPSTDPETQAAIGQDLAFHMSRMNRKRSISNEGFSRKTDVFHGLKGAMFEPASLTTKGMSAAQSRSIRTGAFMRRGGLRIDSEGKMFAVFKSRSADKSGLETLKKSISILDTRREGKKVSLIVGNDPDVAPYGIYVEMGLHPHKGMKKQPFARQTLDALVADGRIVSLLRDNL